MTDTVKVSWSGGKDSTCAVMLHLAAGHKVKTVCYIPMLTDEIPLILKKHYDFILNTAERFRGMGAEVFIVTGMTYYDFVTRIRTKGRLAGAYQGFPSHITHMCEFRNFSKKKALSKCDVGNYDYEDIGIASDEIKRLGQLNDVKRSILAEKGYTEQDALRFCMQNNLLSPHYDEHIRDGCALCYNAKASVRRAYFADYPDAFDVVLKLQNIVKDAMEDGIIPLNHTPLRGGDGLSRRTNSFRFLTAQKNDLLSTKRRRKQNDL